MIYLGVDTNQWIYTALGRFSEIIDLLEDRVRTGYLTVFTNNIILSEWERNKSKTIEQISKSIRTEANSALKLTQYIGNERQKEILKGIISSYRKDESKREEEAKLMVEKVESFIYNRCVLLSISSEEKIQAADIALSKKAPIHKNKNSIADALIFINFINEMKERDRNGAFNDFIFVSNNHTEFSCETNNSILHPDIKKLVDFDLKYYLALPKALNMADDLILNYIYYFELLPNFDFE